MPVTRVKGWIEGNLWAILAAAATAWSGFLTGQMTIKQQIRDLDRRVAQAERQLVGRRAMMVCAVRSFDSVTSKLHIQPPCNMDVPE